MSELYYHYTNGAAFTQILNGKSLWLTNGKFLNDPMDCDLRLNDLSALADKHLKGEVREAFLRHVGNPVEAYVTSFAANSDSLVHWRAYGDDGAGVSIGFDPAKLAGVPEAIGGFRLNVEKMLVALTVNYSREVLESLLDNLFAKYGNAPSAANVANVAVQLILTSRLLHCGYKESAWRAEEEKRLVHLAMVGRDQGLCRSFRVNRGNLHDYAVVEFDPDAVRSITIGPKCMFEPDMVKRFFDSLGYNGVTVDKSKLLYR